MQKIPLFKVYMSPEAELMPALRDVLYSGQISEGNPVYQFEKEFSDYVGHPNILSFYSGTAALHTALILAGVSLGDEVISTAMTAEPTNLAILHAGARPVWADVDPQSGNIDPQSIEGAVTERTKAIIVVHYGGVPARMREIRAVAARHNLKVIEDAAHALGARYEGMPIGVGSDFTMFSLQAIKHMTTVDGGMLACRDPEDASRGRRVRWFGIDRNAPRTAVDIVETGYKYHMNNLNATIGRVQLRHIAHVVEKHIENGRYMDRQLRGISGLTTCRWDEWANPSYWFYTVLAERREVLIQHLASAGIESSLCHRRNDLHSVFSSSKRPLPGLDSFYSRMLHIPCGWWVTPEERDHIVATLRGGW